MNLTNQIQQLIKENGAITFAEFMQRALYTPQLGYYSSDLTKFGRGGDFTTAPELTPLFAQTLANEFKTILKNLSTPIIFEFGAGSGRLCVDLLTALDKLKCLPNQYVILELSADLKARQLQLIQQEIPHLAHLVTWITTWPQQPFNGVIIANEVLDAMPVSRFYKTPTALLESYVDCMNDGTLFETFKPITTVKLQEYLQHALTNVSDYQSEANIWLPDWFKSCAAMLANGAMFVIDYGFPRHEFYHLDRNTGTLMCHYKHKTHPNPFINIGTQDLTAHVDFTHVAEAAHAAGLRVAGYTNQASFLLANGLLNLLSAIEDEKLRILQQQAVKKLLQPDEMGELFKVIALTKNYPLPLTGFQLSDKRASL